MDLPWGPVQSCLGNQFANPNCRPTHSIFPNSIKKGRKLPLSPLGVVPTLPAGPCPGPTAAPHSPSASQTSISAEMPAECRLVSFEDQVCHKQQLEALHHVQPLKRKASAVSQLQELQGYAGAPKYHKMPKSHSIWQCHHTSSNCQTNSVPGSYRY